eukprot:gnl/TRDRNA2_/TRDRNA2_170716_c2_seq1.p1 gnl/TRDRNA2_/TRDRNA2_170716_c2~~gnl/TRDRNA2_/TRDRNA2_170716_c2_seq1.p1  ORF type:complete len:188 (-),score=20.54 gnl/TRDRNA2_/TRDRNA2_170716_c2_seq1:22-501(-)
MNAATEDTLGLERHTNAKAQPGGPDLRVAARSSSSELSPVRSSRRRGKGPRPAQQAAACVAIENGRRDTGATSSLSTLRHLAWRGAFQLSLLHQGKIGRVRLRKQEVLKQARQVWQLLVQQAPVRRTDEVSRCNSALSIGAAEEGFNSIGATEEGFNLQ